MEFIMETQKLALIYNQINELNFQIYGCTHS